MTHEHLPIRVSLELDPGTNPVSGRLYGPEKQTLPFSGYIELMSLIEAIRRKRDTSVRLPLSPPADLGER